MKLLTVTPRQILSATCLCILAQRFMPKGQKFGMMVWGSSGIAKSAMASKVGPIMEVILSKVEGKKITFPRCEFNASNSGPEDLKGLPIIAKNAHGNYITKFAPIHDWKGETASEYGLFDCDELDRTMDPSTINAWARYAIDGAGDCPLPPKWFVLGMGNGGSDSNTTELSEHCRGRMVHVYASVNSAEARRDYETYVSEMDVDPAIKALHRLDPVQSNEEDFEEHAVYNYRTTMYANAIINAYKVFGDDLRNAGCMVDAVLRPLLAGAVGVAMGAELVRLMDFDGLPTLGEIVNKPDTVPVPTDLSLSVKYVDTLCEFASCDHEATQLATYFKRFPDEVARVGLSKLKDTFPTLR